MRRPELIIEDMVPQGRPVTATEKDLRGLADDIHANGLKHPILVMDDVVVDGLKRIEAFKLLGRARIPAVVTVNYGEATHYLQKVREGEKIEPPRNLEIVDDLEPFRQQYHKMRYYPKLAKENAAKPWGKLSTRKMLAQALGVAESYAEAILLIMKSAAEHSEIARRVALIKKGQDTVHGVYKLYRRIQVTGDHEPAAVAEIRTTTTRGFQTLETTIAAISVHGSMLSLPRSEREEIVRKAELAKRQLFQLTKVIKDGLMMEAKEGQEG